MQNFYEVGGLQVQKWLQEMWCNCRQISRKKRQILLLAVKPGPAPRPSAPKCQDCDRIFKPSAQTARETRDERAGTGWSCAYDRGMAVATSLAAETNQRPSREVRSSTPLLRTGLHSVRAHHTEPRKTCSRVGGICNSAIMKRGFVQPCAGQNSEFTQTSSASNSDTFRAGQPLQQPSLSSLC